MMMPIPRCQNPVMKWISRGEREREERERREKRGEGDGGQEREEREVPPTGSEAHSAWRERHPAEKGRGQKPARERGKERGGVCQC